MDIELVDLRDHPLPFFDGLAPARTLRAYPSPEVARFGQTLDRADGFVFVSPEYNHGYPAVLKNALDFTFVEWHRKPVTFVSWGNVGGARAIRAPEPFDTTLLDALLPPLELLGAELHWCAAALAAAR